MLCYHSLLRSSTSFPYHDTCFVATHVSATANFSPFHSFYQPMSCSWKAGGGGGDAAPTRESERTSPFPLKFCDSTRDFCVSSLLPAWTNNTHLPACQCMPNCIGYKDSPYDQIRLPLPPAHRHQSGVRPLQKEFRGDAPSQGEEVKNPTRCRLEYICINTSEYIPMFFQYPPNFIICLPKLKSVSPGRVYNQFRNLGNSKA